jgi:hypothetical protein
MGLAYYVVPLIFQREYPAKALVRIQPYIFASVSWRSRCLRG